MGMEIKSRDLAGRIGKLKIGKKKVETPLILPVINPKKQEITPKEMEKEFGVEGVITNAYIIWKDESLREQAQEKGIHGLLDFDGLVMTDSGAFQLMQYGKVRVTNREIVEFQRDIGVDIGVILDIPGIGDFEKMRENLDTTIERAEEVKDVVKSSKVLWAGPVQGGVFEELRKESARKMLELGFNYFAVGSVVPLLNEYRFKEAFDCLVWAREVIPTDKPVHFFGAGHPMMFAFGVALGADVFDSAAYALFAEKGKYLTVDGTRDIFQMKELPCSCPICSSHSVEELRKNKSLLARHNLYVTMEEMKRVKESIRQGTLWELLEKRARAHPRLYQAFLGFQDYLDYLEEKDPISKKRFFYLSKESELRPEIYRHKKRLQQKIITKKFVDLTPFERVPIEVKDMYPFGQREIPWEEDAKLQDIDDWDIVNGIMGYLYGYYDLLPEDAVIERSKNTGRIRNVLVNKKLWLVLRASDYIPILHGIAWEMAKRDGWKVIVPNGVSEHVRDGKSTFAKFVIDADERIRPGLEVLIVNESGELLATGTARMSGKEMVRARDGVAVDTRKLKPEYAPDEV